MSQVEVKRPSSISPPSQLESLSVRKDRVGLRGDTEHDGVFNSQLFKHLRWKSSPQGKNNTLCFLTTGPILTTGTLHCGNPLHIQSAALCSDKASWHCEAEGESKLWRKQELMSDLQTLAVTLSRSLLPSRLLSTGMVPMTMPGKGFQENSWLRKIKWWGSSRTVMDFHNTAAQVPGCPEEFQGDCCKHNGSAQITPLYSPPSSSPQNTDSAHGLEPEQHIPHWECTAMFSSIMT